MKKINALTPYILLFFIVLIAYWQVGFFQYSLKWDTADAYYPWRFFLAECLRHGHLPLWMPYEMLGYPFFADPQSAAWYPPAWIIALLSGYTMPGVQLEFILSVCMGGWGFYKLAKAFNQSSFAALLIAVSYACSGFFIGNAQHLTWIISAAYLPWIFYYYLKIIRENKIQDALLLALFMFLLLTGGYPAFLMLIGYTLLFIFIFHVLQLSYRKKISQLIAFIKANAITLIVFLLLGAGIIASIMQVQPFINRGAGTSLHSANANPFSPASLLSFLFPFAGIRNTEFFGTDLSMINTYIGIFALLLLGSAISSFRMGRLKIVLLVYGLLSMLASFGAATPIRKWLYEYVPFMNMFRHASLFRLFFIIPFLLIAGFALDLLMQGDGKIRRNFKWISISLFLIIAVIIPIAIHKNYSGASFLDLITNRKQFFEHSTIYDHIIIQSFIQLFFISTLLAAFYFIKEIKWKKAAILTLVAFDLILSTQLNMFSTVVFDIPTQTVTEKTARQPSGFPIPKQEELYLHKEVWTEELSPLWKNIYIFYKQPSADGYNPFALLSYEKLTETKSFDSLLHHPFVYLSDTIVSYQSFNPFKDSIANKKMIYVEDSIYAKYKNRNLKSFSEDNIAITGFNPNRIEVDMTIKQEQILTLLQNNFKGWHVKTDGKEVPFFTSNLAFISLLVPAGTHHVTFEYKPDWIIIPLWLSLSSLIILLIGLLIYFFRNRSHQPLESPKDLSS